MATATEARKYPSAISDGNNPSVSKFKEELRHRMARFAWGLGEYRIFGHTGDQTMPIHTGISGPFMGYAESARQNNYTLTPERGPHHNDFTMLTNLPVEPSKPIDAGMWKFCWSCGKCAENCLANAISKDKEPSWEIPKTGSQETTYHNPGPKHLWSNMIDCYVLRESLGGPCRDTLGGRLCWAVCPMGSDKAASIHAVVRATMANTTLFNGFFATMDDFMGYDVHDPEEWWDLALPVLDANSTIGANKGSYKYA
jgi:epoxyqueuosine reductase